MSGNSSLSGISSLLTEEFALLRDFVSALKSEQELLVGGEIDRLTPILDEKGRLAADLGQRIERRNQALASAGLETDKAGMEAWLAGQTAAARAATRATWEAILTLAREARLLNEINGNLIKTRMQHNQQALSVLQAASNQVLLYGRDGQKLPGSGGRHFGAARVPISPS
jgi:flagellar biosynthesis protein FlgN